jgi:hypothetical protein
VRGLQRNGERRARHCDDSFSISSLLWGGQKGQNAPCVKDWASMLAALAVLSASLALAEDFKTIKGREYKNATIIRVEGDGIVLRTKTGISKVYFVELPRDVQEKFHPRQATPSPAQREPIKLEAKQDGRRQADGGGRVVVVGQSAVSWKIIVAGIVLLVVVVLAVVRSRS